MFDVDGLATFLRDKCDMHLSFYTFFIEQRWEHWAACARGVRDNRFIFEKGQTATEALTALAINVGFTHAGLDELRAGDAEAFKGWVNAVR